MNEDEVLEFAHAMEATGFSDEEIDAYLEHYGVRGMRWGQRRAARNQVQITDSIRRVAAGGGSRRDRRVANAYTRSVVDRVRGRTVEQTSQRGLDRSRTLQTRIVNGEARVQDMLIRGLAGVNIRDMNFSAANPSDAGPRTARERREAIRERRTELATSNATSA